MGVRVGCRDEGKKRIERKHLKASEVSLGDQELLPFLRATYCEAGKEAASSWLPHRFRQPVWQHMTRDTRTLTYTLTRFQETKGKLDPSKSTQWSQMYGVRFIK